MASKITTIIAICILAAACSALEHFGDFHHHIEESELGGGGGGEELLEHHHESEILHHHEPKVATSYQNFNLESKNPVPVFVKKEVEHHVPHEFEIEHHEELENHHLEEPLDFKGF